MDELTQIIELIDLKIQVYTRIVDQIDPKYAISRDVANQLTHEFISDLKQIKEKLLDGSGVNKEIHDLVLELNEEKKDKK